MTWSNDKMNDCFDFVNSYVLFAPVSNSYGNKDKNNVKISKMKNVKFEI